MKPIEQQRLTLLQTGRADSAYLSDYYGLDNIESNVDFCNDLQKFCDVYKRRAKGGQTFEDRNILEEFFQKKKVLPKKWFASQLGLHVEMLEIVLKKLHDFPVPIRAEYVHYGCLVGTELEDELIASLPDLRFRTFGDHESFCSRLHTSLEANLNIDAGAVAGAKLWCATSREMGEYPQRFGKWFDCLTCEALSVRHQMWLDFHKPLYLGPDRCSKLFYARSHNDLDSFVAGSEPTDLDEYMAFTTSRQA
jgi:hypothetical protein